MTQKEIYAQLMFIAKANSLEERETFILEEYELDEDSETGKKFYNYLKSKRYIDKNQDFEFKCLEKTDSLVDYSLYELFTIISKTVTSDYDFATFASLNNEQTYAVLAGFFEKEKDLYKSFIETVKSNMDDMNLNLDYLLSLAPELELPEISVRESSYELSSKSYDILIDGVETISTILEDNMTEENVVLIKKILTNIKKTLQTAT